MVRADGCRLFITVEKRQPHYLPFSSAITADGGERGRWRGAGWEGDLLKKILEAVKKDLWVVLLDIIAVNLSYYLALLIRFYVNFQLRPVAVDRYLPAWISFTPWYTVLCILIFAGFRLYGGLWRYAGINDMNRIILASLSTALLHVLGTTIFYTRMPWTYYLIGALLQFLFIVIIRFSYRVLLVEKKRLRRGERIRCVVIGSGENGRRVVKHLEEEGMYQPIAVVGSGSGTMDGIPIITLPQVNWSEVNSVFIADPLLPTSTRQEIKAQADAAGADVQDYTGFFSNLGGRLSLTELLSTIHGPFTISIDGKESVYNSGEQALQELNEKYVVKEIEGQTMKIVLERGRVMSTQESLKAAYAAVMGEEPPRGG